MGIKSVGNSVKRIGEEKSDVRENGLVVFRKVVLVNPTMGRFLPEEFCQFLAVHSSQLPT